jgi:hypothetical protein
LFVPLGHYNSDCAIDAATFNDVVSPFLNQKNPTDPPPHRHQSFQLFSESGDGNICKKRCFQGLRSFHKCSVTRRADYARWDEEGIGVIRNNSQITIFPTMAQSGKQTGKNCAY